MAVLPPCPTAHPNDDDLTGVVTHLASMTTRRGSIPRDPNATEVRWLLEAGIRAMCEGMLDHSGEQYGAMAYSHANGLFETLPVDRVMHCFRDMCREAGIDPGSANKARLIRRWAFVANYQLDLIAYVFRPALLEHSIDNAIAAIDDAWPDLTLGEVVDAFAIPREQFSPIDPIYRIQQILWLMFPGDTAIGEYSERLNLIKCERWGHFYERFAGALGLTLHDITHADLAGIMHHVSETGLVESANMNRPTCDGDGPPMVVATIRMILASAFRLPWEELAPRRPTSPQPPPDLVPAPEAAQPVPQTLSDTEYATP